MFWWFQYFALIMRFVDLKAIQKSKQQILPLLSNGPVALSRSAIVTVQIHAGRRSAVCCLLPAASFCLLRFSQMTRALPRSNWLVDVIPKCFRHSIWQTGATSCSNLALLTCLRLMTCWTTQPRPFRVGKLKPSWLIFGPRPGRQP